MAEVVSPGRSFGRSFGELPPVAAFRSWSVSHPFLAYIIRRLLRYVFTLWLAITLTFFFFRLIPGNPIEAYIGNLQNTQHVYNVKASSDMVKHYEQVFNLNGNLFQQYTSYMYQLVVHRNMGPSLINFPTPAAVVVARALPWTIGLLGIATFLGWFIGVIIGGLIGWKREKLGSSTITYVGIAVSHIPAYFLAVILVFVFAYRFVLLPGTQAYDPSMHVNLSLPFIISVIKHGTLPAISNMIIAVAGTLLGMRMLMITTLGEDYLTFAEAKGLKPRRVLTKYALKNCYLPEITGLAMSLAAIFNGNVLVETLFNYPGVGHLFTAAVAQLDYNTMMADMIIIIFTMMTAVLILDLILPFLDPRIKYWQ